MRHKVQPISRPQPIIRNPYQGGTYGTKGGIRQW
ncbi:MAG: hypothetical protein K0Q73_8803 [Paenibacillus sp.]|nr:hypothetical protein [Paenibacillus sp.]